MKIIIPPIKSQGIKTKLVPWIMDIAPKVTGKWIEPFLGTGVVAFNAGYKNAILNDTNPHIINFYKGIQQKTITSTMMKHYLVNEGLDNYSLKLTPDSGAVQAIALSGTVPAQGTFVISNEFSSSLVIALSDALTPLLDFDYKMKKCYLIYYATQMQNLFSPHGIITIGEKMK
ncbi:MAG: DNA adenine methylase [Ignavibacteriae bacterium]|nr:DNA adenine methylase [Ignavibacteriota bacterium]